MTTPPPSTDRQLLDTAERMFAELGIEKTSVRALTAEAGANLSAVSYHFGSKEGLVRAVFERRLRPLNEERLHQLGLCEEGAGDGPLPLEEVVRAFVAPVVALRYAVPETAHFARLMGRVVTVPSPVTQEILRQELAPLAKCFTEALSRALPELPPDRLTWGFHFMVGAMAHSCTLASPGGAPLPACAVGPHGWLPDAPRREPGREAEELTGWMVSFLSAGLRALDRDEAEPAPPSEPPNSEG